MYQNTFDGNDLVGPYRNTRNSMNLCSWSTFHERFFSHKLNSIEISCCSHPSFGEMIVMKFCTWHAMCKFCSNMIPPIKLHLKSTFHRIWITLGKSFMNWAPGMRLSITMSFYGYTGVFWHWVFYLYNANPHTWNMTCYILNFQGPLNLVTHSLKQGTTNQIDTLHCPLFLTSCINLNPSSWHG